MILINESGEHLQTLQIGQEVEPQERQRIVTLNGYYEVLNDQRYPDAVWDFGQEKWIGVGQQRPVVIPEPSEFDKIRIESAQANAELFEMMLMMMGVV